MLSGIFYWSIKEATSSPILPLAEGKRGKLILRTGADPNQDAYCPLKVKGSNTVSLFPVVYWSQVVDRGSVLVSIAGEFNIQQWWCFGQTWWVRGHATGPIHRLRLHFHNYFLYVNQYAGPQLLNDRTSLRSTGQVILYTCLFNVLSTMDVSSGCLHPIPAQIPGQGHLIA